MNYPKSDNLLIGRPENSLPEPGGFCCALLVNPTSADCRGILMRAAFMSTQLRLSADGKDMTLRAHVELGDLGPCRRR